MCESVQVQYAEPYNRLAEIYDRVMEHVNYKQWARYIKTILENHKATRGRLADLSCGSGSFLDQLSLKHSWILGCDLSLAMLHQARQKSGLKSQVFCTADFTELPFQTNSFNATVALYDSVNYLLNRESALLFFEEVNRILEPGGVFIFDAVTPHVCKTVFRDFYETKTLEDGSAYQRHGWYDAVQKTQYNAFRISDDAGDTEEVHEQKIRPIREWKKLLKESPLSLEEVYGNFTLRPAQRKSERAHFVCMAR